VTRLGGKEGEREKESNRRSTRLAGSDMPSQDLSCLLDWLLRGLNRFFFFTENLFCPLFISAHMFDTTDRIRQEDRKSTTAQTQPARDSGYNNKNHRCVWLSG
jgi:hypothetical protein